KHPIANLRLARFYDYGIGVKQNKTKANFFYRRANDFLSLSADNTKNFIEQLLELAKQGDANAQYELGLLYELGLIVAKDEKEAMEWFRKAAKQGHEKAKAKLPIASKSKKTIREWYAGKPIPIATCNQPDINSLQPGDTFQDCLSDGSLGPKMVVIPSGSFRMGDIQGGGRNNEKPVHWVNINYQFAMGQYEVTFAEYDKFAEATDRKKPNDRGWGRDNRPVINVSWDDAVAYTKWLSQQTGREYRLPSESEWEYSARAGTETKYWWGNDIGENNANCNNTYCGDSFKNTAPVGSFAANQFGLYDTVGNVWEWCADAYQNSYENAPEDGSIWEKGNKYRVLRGGSWFSNSNHVRSDYRYWLVPSIRLNLIGFRVVRML
ncbi:SUMF1/EgtB/PvdO family nonheme iron enzyme, partial [Thiotrichales bacterium HSG1]|nr:SUMF1/EgtB/PvdO family nonheme iron enzyme [Thiotrichales bacterium HSG1]